ncbi:inner membrane CreD family protein [Algoriphagus ratkowskyi]|uniref:Cell envelope integrity protein CreD n=1 Tax=Algoriphagus ratkowskyi TaxID=57028 RepID=A0ABY3HSN9_9BACT|nr:cell envelope integrity protein CreD [Algoriphagus ratkowskyi]
MFTGIHSVFYLFIFAIFKHQDYALVIGSIGLLVAAKMTMFIPINRLVPKLKS